MLVGAEEGGRPMRFVVRLGGGVWSGFVRSAELVASGSEDAVPVVVAPGAANDAGVVDVVAPLVSIGAPEAVPSASPMRRFRIPIAATMPMMRTAARRTRPVPPRPPDRGDSRGGAGIGGTSADVVALAFGAGGPEGVSGVVEIRC